MLIVSTQVAYDGQLEYFDDEDVEIMELFASFVGPKLRPRQVGTAAACCGCCPRTSSMLSVPISAEKNSTGTAQSRKALFALSAQGTEKKEVSEGRLALGLEIPTSSGSQRLLGEAYATDNKGCRAAFEGLVRGAAFSRGPERARRSRAWRHSRKADAGRKRSLFPSLRVSFRSPGCLEVTFPRSVGLHDAARRARHRHVQMITTV